MKRHIILLILCTIIVAAISILMVKSIEKEYWVIGKYPVAVNNKVKEQGYKVIGKYKLWNPNPRPITLEDAGFIKTKLPEWLAGRYSNEEVDTAFQQISNQELINKLHYVFTMLHQGRTTEADFYLLTLKNKGKSINIYIGKGLDSDPHPRPLTLKLIYSFYDEEWHKNIEDPVPFKQGDLW